MNHQNPQTVAAFTDMAATLTAPQVTALLEGATGNQTSDIGFLWRRVLEARLKFLEAEEARMSRARAILGGTCK